MTRNYCVIRRKATRREACVGQKTVAFSATLVEMPLLQTQSLRHYGRYEQTIFFNSAASPGFYIQQSSRLSQKPAANNPVKATTAQPQRFMLPFKIAST